MQGGGEPARCVALDLASARARRLPHALSLRSCAQLQLDKACKDGRFTSGLSFMLGLARESERGTERPSGVGTGTGLRRRWLLQAARSWASVKRFAQLDGQFYTRTYT